jgi:hypothetical protein
MMAAKQYCEKCFNQLEYEIYSPRCPTCDEQLVYLARVCPTCMKPNRDIKEGEPVAYGIVCDGCKGKEPMPDVNAIDNYLSEKLNNPVYYSGSMNGCFDAYRLILKKYPADIVITFGDASGEANLTVSHEPTEDERHFQTKQDTPSHAMAYLLYEAVKFLESKKVEPSKMIIELETDAPERDIWLKRFNDCLGINLLNQEWKILCAFSQSNHMTRFELEQVLDKQ